MILKYAFRHFARRPVINFFLILQLIAILFVCIAMVSSIVSRNDEYKPIKPLISGQGGFYAISNGFEPDTGLASLSPEYIQSKLKGESKVCGSYFPMASVLYHNKWNMQDFECITYDDELLFAIEPRLLAGEWFQNQQDYGDAVPVVVSESTGLSVGTHLTYTQDNEHKSVYDAVVIGILPDSTRILKPAPPRGNPVSAHYFYYNYNTEIEGKHLLIASEKAFSKDIHGQPNGLLIVQYSGSLSDEELAYNQSYLRSLRTIQFSSDLEKIRECTESYIYEQCAALFPIAVSVLILSLTSLFSMSALASKRQLRDYAVYATCGLPWNKCAWIQAGEIMIAGTAALVITWGLLLFWNPISSITVVRLGWQQFISSIGVMLFCFLTAMVIPLRLIRKHSAKTILNENER